VIRPPKTPPLAEFDGIGTYKTSMKNTTLQAMHHLRQPEGIEKKQKNFFDEVKTPLTALQTDFLLQEIRKTTA